MASLRHWRPYQFEVAPLSIAYPFVQLGGVSTIIYGCRRWGAAAPMGLQTALVDKTALGHLKTNAYAELSGGVGIPRVWAKCACDFTTMTITVIDKSG